MRITELIEAIDQTAGLTQATYDLLTREIDQFIRWNAESIFDSVGEGDYLKKMSSLEKRIEEIRERGLDWREEDKLVSSLQYKSQDISGNVQSKLYNSEPNTDIVEEFIDVMELHLQDLARDYMEAQFGKIEQYKHDEPWDENKKKNLYWLQHIIVQLDTTGKNEVTGEPKTGGGYFQRQPQKSTLHSRSSQQIDWQNDLAQHINIYTSKEKLWTVLTHRLLEKDSVNRYGDSGVDNPVPKFLKELVSTYVHEVVHMDQNARARIKQQTSNKSFGRGDYTKIPDTSVRRPQLYAYDKNDTRGKASQKDSWRRKYRGGRRGQETYDIEKYANNLDRWAAYLGSVNEIEAHASHAATEFYSNFISNEPFRYSYSINDKQRRVNEFIDSAIEDVKWGYFPNNTYPNIIAPTARQAMANSNPTARERQFLKVWKLYLKKIVKHLQSYKKEVPKDDWS